MVAVAIVGVWVGHKNAWLKVPASWSRTRDCCQVTVGMSSCSSWECVLVWLVSKSEVSSGGSLHPYGVHKVPRPLLCRTLIKSSAWALKQLGLLSHQMMYQLLLMYLTGVTVLLFLSLTVYVDLVFSLNSFHWASPLMAGGRLSFNWLLKKTSVSCVNPFSCLRKWSLIHWYSSLCFPLSSTSTLEPPLVFLELHDVLASRQDDTCSCILCSATVTTVCVLSPLCGHMSDCIGRVGQPLQTLLAQVLPVQIVIYTHKYKGFSCGVPSEVRRLFLLLPAN